MKHTKSSNFSLFMLKCNTDLANSLFKKLHRYRYMRMQKNRNHKELDLTPDEVSFMMLLCKNIATEEKNESH